MPADKEDMGRGQHQGNTSDVLAKKGHAEESETIFAAILDRAGITYEYEPHRLHVGKLAVNGKVKDRALQPDFWLPGLGMYVELTTSRNGSLNMGLKLAKVKRLNNGQGQHRICILNGKRLAWMLENGNRLHHTDIAAVLEKEYRATCKKAGIRTREESAAARAQRELTAA